jgi:hypothetical protein
MDFDRIEDFCHAGYLLEFRLTKKNTQVQKSVPKIGRKKGKDELTSQFLAEILVDKYLS